MRTLAASPSAVSDADRYSSYLATPLGRFKRGRGTIINIASGLGIVPEVLNRLWRNKSLRSGRLAVHSTKSLANAESAFRWFCQVPRRRISGRSPRLRLSTFRAKWS